MNGNGLHGAYRGLNRKVKLSLMAAMDIVLMLVSRSSAEPGLQNVALRKPTWQSSAGSGYYTPERAVDGRTSPVWGDGSCFATEGTEIPIWGVNLQFVTDIIYVDVVNRAHEPWGLSNFIITISNSSYPMQASQFADPSFVRCGQYNGYPDVPTLMGRVTCSPGPIRGQFVYVSLTSVSQMTFCEAKVYGVAYGHVLERLRGCSKMYSYGILPYNETQPRMYEMLEVNDDGRHGCVGQCSQHPKCTAVQAGFLSYHGSRICRLLLNP